jgi:hypothetical protein
MDIIHMDMIHIGETDMGKLANALLASLIAVMFVAAPVAASAYSRHGSGAGYCKSGKVAKDVKLCKENGGKK